MKKGSLYAVYSLFLVTHIIFSNSHAAGRWGSGPGGPWGGGGTTTSQLPVIAPQNFSVEENSPNGTNVGTLVASDPDGDVLSYAITTGNLDNAFNVNAVTGALTVANTAALDFETTPGFSLTVQVTDTAGLADSALVAVSLIDVAEDAVVGNLLPPLDGDPAFLTTHFSGSANCARCHNGITDASGTDVSIEQDWATSMMANASRDPYWRAKVTSELKRNPQLKGTIDDKCSRCHAPMANVEARQDGAAVEIFGDGFLNPANANHDAAVDAVSCALCHQVADDDKFGTMESFSGGFSIARLGVSGERPAYGQYLDPRINPMLNNTGFRPQYGAHVSDSELCASCHNVKTPFVDANGTVVTTTHDTEFPEQMVFSEWENSDFGSGATKTSCQDCHMPASDGVRIANRPRFLASRDAFARHTMTGANTVMLDILANNREALGVTATGFDAAIARTREFLSSAASVEVVSSAVGNGELEVVLNVSNQSGHKLPTGYPSRRTYLHFVVQDSGGQILFESGRTNLDGSIAGVVADQDLASFEPHYDVIMNQDQVQVYETIMEDVNGAVTYTLLEAAGYIKDNRLTPSGFDKTQVGDDIAVRGAALADDDFNLGGDTVTYRVDVGGASGSLTVTAELRYQTLAYGHLQDLFQDADQPEVARFKQMYERANIRSESIASVAATIVVQ